MASPANPLSNPMSPLYPQPSDKPSDKPTKIDTCKRLLKKLDEQSLTAAHDLVNTRKRRREDSMESTLDQRDVRQHTDDLPATKHSKLRGEFNKLAAVSLKIEVGEKSSQAVDYTTPEVNEFITGHANGAGLSVSVTAEYFQSVLPYFTDFIDEVFSMGLNPDEMESFEGLMEANQSNGLKVLAALMKEEQQHLESSTEESLKKL